MVVVPLLGMISIMIGLVAASEPLYRMFCSATGFGGTTRNAITIPAETENRIITVNFDGNVDPALPWDFAPETRSVQVKLGEDKLIKYRVHNRSPKTVVGTAVDNVQPDKVGLYFDKTQCFCFTKQVLKPGETRELPVEFYIDPEIAKDRGADDVTSVTLSYTFYLAKDQKKAHNAQPPN
jgi:cytochrome c oxidase assembly protein subunit 11